VDRRRLLLLLAGVLVAPLAVGAQSQMGKIHRIGVIVGAGASNDLPGPNPRNPSVAALLHGLRDLGYVYGRDFVTRPRSIEGAAERGSSIAIELARLNVDVMVVAGPALPGVKQARVVTPVVMSGAGDPIQAGFVGILARPGGNFTGMSLQNLELSRKRLQLITEIVPGAVRVAVLRGPDSDGEWAQIREAAGVVNREVLSLEVRGASEIEGAFRTATEWHAAALVVFAGGLLDREARQVVQRASTHRLPTMYSFRNFYMAEGGLISYGADLLDIWRRAATYVDRISEERSRLISQWNSPPSLISSST
jgi:putative ABC transport system substrate-binding protein